METLYEYQLWITRPFQRSGCSSLCRELSLSCRIFCAHDASHYSDNLTSLLTSRNFTTKSIFS